MTHLRLVFGVVVLFTASCSVGTAYYADPDTTDSGVWAVDSAVAQFDAAVAQFDAAVGQPDSAVTQPDSAVTQPDAAVTQSDAAVAQQDSGTTGSWTAPDFTLQDRNPASPTYGQDLTASDNLGKVVIIYFSSFS